MSNTIRVVTHPTPDLDALASAWGLAFILDAQARLVFLRQPAADDHAPDSGRFVVDIGGGPLDHHRPLPGGGSVADRSTCAFLLVCAWGQRHPDAGVQRRAAALLRHVAPSVLRQDSTGSIASPADAVADALGMPQMIKVLHLRLDDDQAVAAAVQPWLRLLFEAAVEREEAEARARALLPLVARTPAPEVLLLDFRSHNGDMALMFDVTWAQYPDAQIMTYRTVHQDANGGRVTVSRGMSRRQGSQLNVADLVRRILNLLPLASDVAEELRRWHCEPWFAGRGAMKAPVADEPPITLLNDLGVLLPPLIVAQEIS
jgi:hypothetical protein